MDWLTAETVIRAHIETQWASGAYAAIPLEFDNENGVYAERYVAVSIEGVYAEKTLYGSAGKRSSVEAGVIFFHAFTPTGSGKTEATGAVQAMTTMLELQTLGSGAIKLEGGAPPSPIEYGSEFDRGLPRAQPGGNYYRCSGSVPFVVIDSR